jgi:hypothetical protein
MRQLTPKFYADQAFGSEGTRLVGYVHVLTTTRDRVINVPAQGVGLFGGAGSSPAKFIFVVVSWQCGGRKKYTNEVIGGSRTDACLRKPPIASFLREEERCVSGSSALLLTQRTKNAHYRA